MALGDPVLNGVALLGDLPAGGFKITNLAAGVGAGDAARYDELNTLDGLVIKKDGSVTFTANQPMGGFKLTGLAAGAGAGESLRWDELGAASGIATLDAASKVVQDPASKGLLNGVAELDASVLVPEAQIPHTLANLLTLNGGATLGANLAAGGFKVTGLAAGVGAGDAARYDELNTLDGLVIKKDGSVTFTADQPLGGFKLLTFGGAEFENANISLVFKDLEGATKMVQIGAYDFANLNGSVIKFYGGNYAAKNGWLILQSHAHDRLTLKDGLTCDALWEDCIHIGLKLGGALDANSQKVTGLLAPTAEGDAVSLGDPVLSGAEVAVVADVNVIGGIPVVHRIAVAGGANADTDVTLTHKERVIDAWMVLKGGGTAGSLITVKNAANAISEAVDIAAGLDKAIFRITEIDDDNHEIAGAGTLRVSHESTGGDCPAVEVYVLCIRVA